ncbi:cupredoxin domain-containing protein [Granulicella arctica]|uniref:cupredoxin domain-containing protein n=1 Tax=Granulicella arctica TaxID=940613 RepID=UPI0021E0139C|nr:cupredoxin domain-containing protein [Granulicella arctica]
MKLKSTQHLFILAILAVLSVATQRSHAQGPRRVEITAKRFTFSPAEITLKKNEQVTILLTSEDVDHGLKFKDLNIVLKVKKGQTSETSFTPTQAGTFVGQCAMFCGSGHGSMKMTLHVTE